MAKETLIEETEYSYSHIQSGTMIRMPGMKRFISSRRGDGLYLLKLDVIDERIKAAARMLAAYDSKGVVVTASRIYAITPAKKFAELTGTRLVEGRVMPGTFTNPNRKDFTEPELILVSDTRNERQAVREASKTNVPIIALCDTDNWIKYVDLVIPCNNKSRRSLALVYWLLAREYLKEKGLIKGNDEFKPSISDFEAKVEIRMK